MAAPKTNNSDKVIHCPIEIINKDQKYN